MGTATETSPDPHQQYALRWNDYYSSFSKSVGNLRDKAEFVDVTLACEGYSFEVHKMVLSACSPYFKGLLMANPCQHPIIVMRDVHQKDMDSLLKFMYNGEVNVSRENLKNFLRLARMFEIKGLSDLQSGGASTTEHQSRINRTDDSTTTSDLKNESQTDVIPERLPLADSSDQPKSRRRTIAELQGDNVDSSSNSNSSPLQPPHKQPRLTLSDDKSTTGNNERQNNNITDSLLEHALEGGPNIIVNSGEFITHSNSPFPTRPQSNCYEDNNSNSSDDEGGGDSGRGDNDNDREIRQHRRRRYDSDCNNDRSDPMNTLKADDSIEFQQMFDNHLGSYPVNGAYINRGKLPSFPTPPLLGLQGLGSLINAAGPSAGLHGTRSTTDFAAARRSLEMMKVRATDPRPCPQCGKIYRSAHTLRTHLEDKHTVCPGYRCVLCGTVAKSRNSLHSHMSRQHRGISTKDLPVSQMPTPFDPDLASKLLAKAGVKISPAELRARASPTSGGPRRSDVKLDAKNAYSGGAASEAGSSICGENDPEDLTISHGRYNNTTSSQAASVALAAKSFESIHQHQQQLNLKEPYAGHVASSLGANNLMGSVLLDTYLQLINDNGNMMMGMMNPEAVANAVKMAQLNAFGLNNADKSVQQHYLSKLSQQAQNDAQTDDDMGKKEDDDENSTCDVNEDSLVMLSNNRSDGGNGRSGISDKKDNEDNLVASSVGEDDDFSDDDVDNDRTGSNV